MALTDYRDYARIDAGDDPNILGLLPAPNNDAGIAVDPIGALWLYVNTNAPGSKWVLQKEHYIKRVATYTELRNLINYLPDAVIVNDFTYTFAGNTYTTLGGVFYKATSGTEDGGITIVAIDGTIWRRDWDKVNVQPEWWEVGGYDVRGRIYTNKNVLSSLANTAFGGLQTFYDGVYDDSDRIQNAIWVADNYGLTTVKVQYQKRDYVITKVISNLLQKLSGSVFIDGEHNFNGANLIRKINSSVVLTSPILASATTINVSDASNYKVGQSLTVYNTTSPFGGLGFDESGYYLITGISGNTITVINETPSKTFIVANTKVMLEITLFDNRGNGGTLTYRNAIITGNKLNDGVTRFIQDWRYNYNIAAGTGASFTTFENITVKDTPGENFTTAAGIVKNCRGFGLDGSFFHYSMNDARYALGLNTGVNIEDCYVDGVCLATDVVSDHNEAAITNSLHTEFIKLTNCTFKNGSEYIIAMDYVQADTKQSYIVSNCIFENFKAIHINNGQFAATPEREDGLIIIGCKFYNCGDFVSRKANSHANDVCKGKSQDQVIFSDNIFIGSRFYFSGFTNVSFTNNQVLFRDETNSTYPDFGNLEIDVNPQRAAIHFDKSSKIDISNNIIENQRTEHAKLMIGISFPAEYHTRMKDGAGANTNFYYEQGVTIDNNKVLGFHTGINCLVRPNQILENIALPQYGHIAWSVSNNIVVLSGETPTFAVRNWGIGVGAGVITKNNTIYQQRNDNDQAGIFAVNGFFFPATNNGVLGAIITDNFIYGHPSSTGFDITVGVFGNGWHNYNCVVKDNLYVRSLDGSNAARNHFVGNIDLATTLTAWTPIDVPQFQTFEWNTSNY